MQVRWVPTTPEVYHRIYAQHHADFVVFESLTDCDGQYGAPRIVTVWGFNDADCGLIKSVGTCRTQEEPGYWSKWEYFIGLVTKEKEG